MGLVKRGDEKEQYVMKEIKLTGMSSMEKAATKAEVSILRKMRHPNVVKYVDSSMEGSTLKIIMEWAR